MNSITEGRHPGEFLAGDGGSITRDAAMLAEGNNLPAGAVLGQITLGDVTAEPTDGNTGNGTIATGDPALLPNAQAGVYLVMMTAATTFEVFDPKGNLLGTGAAAEEFANQVAFTVTAGGTPLVAGDSFTVTVEEGSGDFTELDPDAVDGSQYAAGILYGRTDASEDDAKCVVVRRMQEVKASLLAWPDDITAGEKAAALAQLEALNIVAR